jgi:hypothetical protein
VQTSEAAALVPSVNSGQGLSLAKEGEMRPYQAAKRLLARSPALAALPILMVACGAGVSEEEFQAVQGDLQAAQA